MCDVCHSEIDSSDERWAVELVDYDCRGDVANRNVRHICGSCMRQILDNPDVKDAIRKAAQEA